MTTAIHKTGSGRRPLLGVRRQPGRLVLWFMRLPRPLYHRGLGRLLGHTFLLIVHAGRKTGKHHETVVMAVAYDPVTREVVVCSAWGANTEWIRNLRAQPALKIKIGTESYAPKQRFLPEEEAVSVASEFRRRHPHRLRLISAILGWGDLTSDAAVRDFVRDRPFVSFAPMHVCDLGSDVRRRKRPGRGESMLLSVTLVLLALHTLLDTAIAPERCTSAGDHLAGR